MTDIIDLAHRHNVPVIVDPKVAHISRYKGATIITPNHLEAVQAAGLHGEDEATLLEAGRQLYQRLGCQAVLITRGERGMSLFEDRGRVAHIPTAARGVSRIVVATDDVRIRDCVMGFGGEAILTGSDLRTGSDRVAAVAREVPADAYVNLQGDEIPLAPGLLEDLIHPFIHSDAEVGTLKRAITEEHELLDPNVVKVLTDRNGDALYFSRSPVPYRSEERR